MKYIVLSHPHTSHSGKASGISLVKIEKSNGPRQLPWGIPNSTWIMLERLPLKFTLCVLLDSVATM
jgi:hypothetical protein